jgi:hypothetical protein
MTYVRYLHLKKFKYIHKWQTILSLEMLHKDYNLKCSVEKTISSRQPQGAWGQNKLIGDKPLVLK